MSRGSSLLAVLAVLLWLAAPAALAATYGLQVHAPPPAPPSPPVTRVRIMLESSTDIPAGATITFTTPAGNTSVPVRTTEAGGPFISVAGTGTPPLTDQVRVTGGGTKQIIIDYKLRGLLADPASLCVLAGGQDGSRLLQFTPDASFNNITGHRVTAYSAPGPDQCICAVRRRKSLTSWTTAPPGTDRGRMPMDIVLVLDRSGSMSETTPGDPQPVPKWTALQAAVTQFTRFWEAEGFDPFSQAGGFGLAKDRLGLVLFETRPVPVLFGGKRFIERGAMSTPGAGHPWEQLVKHINGISAPQGNTTLGGGIRDGVLGWAAEPGVGNDLTLVVMTDGMQNQPPMVNAGSGPYEGLKVLEFTTGAETPLRDQCIPMLTVSVGTAASAYADLMNAIALQTAGQGHLSTSSTLTLAFAQTLVESLKGSTVSTLFQSQRMVSSTGGSHLKKVQVDTTARRLYVVLGWFRHDLVMELTVRAPGGAIASPVVSLGDGRHIIHRYDLPRSGPAGEWTLAVESFEPGTRSPGSGPGPGPGPVPGPGAVAIPYQLSAYVEERSLDFRLSLAGQRHSAGRPLKLQVEAIFDGRPLEGLTGGALTVQVERPSAALGTLLHEARVPAQPGQPAGGNGDTVSPYQAKLDALLKDKAFLAKVGTLKSTEPLPLQAVGPGRYALELADTRVPGRYRFHVTLDARGPRGVVLQRQESIETQVDVLPHGPSTLVKVQKVGTGVFDMVMTPRDELGNYLGPGYEDLIGVRQGSGTLVSQISAGAPTKAATLPDVTGTYRLRLTRVREDRPIAVYVAGEPVASGLVTNLEAVKPGTHFRGDRGGDASTVDAGSVEAAMPDAGMPDAGTGNGTSIDTQPPPGPGCGCRRTPTRGAMGMVGLLFLGLVSSRRRRREDD